MPGGNSVAVSVLLLSCGSYPDSPAIADCQDDAAVSAKLAEVNEYYEESATLPAVLTHIFRVLRADPLIDFQEQPQSDESDCAMDVEEEDDGEEDEVDDYGDMAERDDDEFTKLLGQMRSRWERCETAAQEGEAAPPDDGVATSSGTESTDAAAALTSEEAKASGRQIFSVKEAYAMLSSELLDIFQQRSSINVSAVDDSVYHWDVKLAAFEASSPLAEDLAALRRQGGEGCVHLRLKFKRGLHPFFPPAVQLIGPRFHGPLLGALCSHPMLQLSYWDPWMRQQELLEHMRTFLQAAARVDLSASAVGYEPAYLPVEHALARLEALTGVAPACLMNPDHAKTYSLREAGVDTARLEALASTGPTSKRAKTAEQGQKRAWAAGVGYGSGSHGALSEVWNAKKSQAAQAAQDLELQRLFLRLADSLRGVLDAQKSSGTSTDNAATSIASVEGSCLLPFLEQQLGSASFTDMAKRAEYYAALLGVVEQLCLPSVQQLLMPLPLLEGGQSKGLLAVLQQLKTHAQRFLTIINATGAGAPRNAPQGRTSRALSAGARAASAELLEPGVEPALSAAEQALLAEEAASRGLAEQLVSVAQKAQTAVTRAGGRASRAETRRASSQRAASAASLDASAAYIAHMQPLQLDQVPGVSERHHFAASASAEGAAPRERVVRCGKEIAGLATDLPCNPSSSVFVRVDQSTVTLWRALITGPEDTPYAGGCFVFDIYFPTTYPHTAPKVNLMTTGGGSVRFNPNLYNCGKVCLSLLGTWSGGQGESWDPVASSALQVLVSIQSLILVEDPYFNEPGFESSMHDERGKKESAKYDLNIREQTLHWAVWQQLKSPPPGFEDVVQHHFRLRRAQIQATGERWVAEAKTQSAQVADRMQTYLNNALALIPAS